MKLTTIENVKLYHVALSEEEIKQIQSALSYDCDSLEQDAFGDMYSREAVEIEKRLLADIEDILGKGETNAQN